MSFGGETSGSVAKCRLFSQAAVRHYFVLSAHVTNPSNINIYFSCKTGHVEVVDLLLKHNSKGDHQTKTGCTPLMEATRLV